MCGPKEASVYIMEGKMKYDKREIFELKEGG
jgi:hypothetical protein